jgi:ATP-binding cassette subfamily B protein
MISRGFVSLRRIAEVTDSPVAPEQGVLVDSLKGDIEFRNVSLTYKTAAGEEKTVLKDVSFTINAKTKTAIVGPTAAGKTQLFYLMSGLAEPTSGDILIDGKPIRDYNINSLLKHIGLVFQDSILFNTTLRDNIAFTNKTDDATLQKALETSELGTLVKELPKGLDTMVSERGTSLSGGQKQRLMLARALAVEPQILLLDDFTARVDQATESLILGNVAKNYPGVTLISITQKIDPIKDYHKIIVLMEGEMVATGTHDELLQSSFEYNQIYQSQMSTEALNK